MNMHKLLTPTAALLLASGAAIHTKSDALEEIRTSVAGFTKTMMERQTQSETALQKAAKENAARLTELEQKAVRDPGGNFFEPETWGRQVANSDEIRSVSSNWRGRTRLQVRATITSATTDAAGSAGDLVSAHRPGGIIDLPRRKLRVRQLFSPGETSSNAIEWPMMTARTNNAAMVAETGLKPQSDLKFDLKQWPVRTLAHWMLTSKQILDDVPALTSVIDSELRYGLADVEDYQFLLGAGTGEDLSGVYTTASTFVAPFAITNPTMIDTLLQAVAQVDEAEYETDGIVLNPIDWRMIQALKDANGRYLGGGPFAEQIARLWQMPIVPSKAMTRDKFLVGAFKQGAQIFDRQEATVEISTEDSDNFRKNLVTLRGEERLAFVVKYPGAFVKGDFGNVT